jgi:hypothetical protein
VAPAATQDERWASLASGPLLLVAPFVVFAKHHGYGLLRAELLACVALLAALGLLAGAALARGGVRTRVAGLALLAALFVDVSAEWADASGLALPAAWAAAALAGWVVRDHVAAIACVVVGALLAATLVLPGGRGALRPLDLAPASAPGSASGSALPPVVHLVLDEHAGLEGVARGFDPDGRAAAARLERFYTGRGFRVFARAYSRYYDTRFALPNLLNLTHSESFRRGVRAGLGANAYFREMQRRGYRIHVVQSDHLDYCRSAQASAVASCFTYPLETLDVLEDAPLARREKVRIILGVYARLSVVATELLGRAASQLRAVGVEPPWAAARVSSLVAMRVLDQLAEQLPGLAPGSLVFVHLMLPHFPYAWDAACRLRPDARDWLWANLGGPLYRNTPASRAQRIPRYLEQLECLYAKLGGLLDAMERSGVLARARILVHGDHGSRTGLHAPSVVFEKELSPSDYLEAYSTLFAVREPGGAGGVERAPLALEELLGAWLRGERAEPAEEPWVYLLSPPPRLARRPLRAFDDAGSASAATALEAPR